MAKKQISNGFEKDVMTMLTSQTFSRIAAASQLGMSFDNKRDMYASCGYERHLTIDMYHDVFSRGDIGKTIISAFPDATWSDPPKIREKKDSQNNMTAFEQDFENLIERLPLFSYINRADILSGIGEYGVLFLGFDGAESLDQPVSPGKHELVYVRPFMQGAVGIVSYEQDIFNPRYGYPTMYEIRLNSHSSELEVTSVTEEMTPTLVHWTRVIHIADNREQSDIFGVPRLKPLYNRLFDVQKILGCSPEMFWQGAFQGLAFQAKEDAEIANKEELKDEIEKFVHGMQRYMSLQGIDTKVLSSPVADPANHISVQLMFISGTTRIPLRILTGSERGELASVQDESNWKARVDERRLRHATDGIMKPTIDRLIEYGVLSKPVKGYYLEWRDISASTKKQQMEMARIITDSLRIYVEGQVYKVMAPEVFLEKVMRFSKEDIAEMGTLSAEELIKQAESVNAGVNDKKAGREMNDERKFTKKDYPKA